MGQQVAQQLEPFSLQVQCAEVTPVMFPPGRARLATIPSPTGSATATMTRGIDVVAFFTARVAGRPSGNDHVHLQGDQLSDESRKALILSTWTSPRSRSRRRRTTIRARVCLPKTGTRVPISCWSPSIPSRRGSRRRCGPSAASPGIPREQPGYWLDNFKVNSLGVIIGLIQSAFFLCAGRGEHSAGARPRTHLRRRTWRPRPRMS
jgi:hypothetical protein